MKLPDVFQMRVDHAPGFTHVVKRLESGRFKVKWARGWSEVTDIEWSICDEEEAADFVVSGGWIVVDENKKAKPKFPDNFTVESGSIKWAMRKNGSVWYAYRIGTNVPCNKKAYTMEDIEGHVAKRLWRSIVEEAKQEYTLPDEVPQLPSVFYFIVDEEGEEFKAVECEGGFHITWDFTQGGYEGIDYAAVAVEKFIRNKDWKIINKQPLTAEQLRSNAEAREQIASLLHNIKLRKQDVEHAEILMKNYQERIDQLKSKLVEE